MMTLGLGSVECKTNLTQFCDSALVEGPSDPLFILNNISYSALIFSRGLAGDNTLGCHYIKCNPVILSVMAITRIQRQLLLTVIIDVQSLFYPRRVQEQETLTLTSCNKRNLPHEF